MSKLLKELSEQFWDKGYIIIEEYFDENLMDDYTEMILKHYGQTPEWGHDNKFLNKSATEVIPWFPYLEGNTRFNTINDDQFLSDLTTSIIGENWSDLYCMCMFSKRGSKGQAWHQDCPPENPDIFNLNRLVYTHDITPELGGELCVMEGTQKKGITSSWFT